MGNNTDAASAGEPRDVHRGDERNAESLIADDLYQFYRRTVNRNATHNCFCLK